MSNLSNNRIDVRLSDAELTDIIASIQRTESLFNGNLRSLTTDERVRLPKIAQNNYSFVADAINSADTGRDILPAYLTGDNIKNDLAYYDQLKSIHLHLARLQEKVADTMMLAGSEAYVSALAVYRIMQNAAKAGVPGADAIASQLGTRFRPEAGNPEAETQEVAAGAQFATS